MTNREQDNAISKDNRIEKRLDRLEDKIDHQFERIFKELSHLRGKVYAGAGAISIIVTLVVSKLKGWI